MSEQPLKDLLDKIHTGQTKMLPKSYFILRMIFTALGLLSVLALAVFFCSFAVFYLRIGGYTMLPRFGLLGFKDLFLYFPWLITTVVILFLLALAYAIFKRTAAYKTPALYSALGILVLVIVAGIAVANTPLHMQLWNSARQGKLPVVGGIYMGYGMMRPHDMFVGTVKNLTGNNFVLQIDENQIFLVNYDQSARLPFGSINNGDAVMVMGSVQGGTITAYGISPLGNSGTSAYPQDMLQMHQQMMGGSR
jgi:hypothetical protein